MKKLVMLMIPIMFQIDFYVRTLKELIVWEADKIFKKIDRIKAFCLYI